MIPFLAALAAGTTAYLLYRILRRLRKNNGSGNSNPSSFLQSLVDDMEQNFATHSQTVNDLLSDIESGRVSPDGIDSSGNESYRLPSKYDPVQSMFDKILAIVQQVSFSERKVSIRKKIGDESVPSNIPTGDIEIQKMRDLSDLPKALPGHLAADDDIFYPNLATGNVFIQQPVEFQGVYADQFFAPRKIYRISQDVSGSTRGDRIAWSRMLDYLLLRKARNAGADFLLTTFTDSIVESVSATSEDMSTFDKANAFINHNIAADGGTNINLAILDQLRQIEEENEKAKAKQDAQIIIVTDGTEGINEKLITQKIKDNQVKLHTVVLGKRHDQLKRVSDKYHFLDIPGIG